MSVSLNTFICSPVAASSSSRARGPARLAATRLPVSGPERVVCASCGEARCSPKCACAGCATRRASRRAFVAATGLVPLLFFRDESSAAPSPTNVDDMEARKMAREEMLKAARAKAAAQAAAEAGTAAPAPAPAPASG